MNLLMNLRESKLRDPALLDEFYEKILMYYDCAENYYIVLIHAVYDVPGKTSDGEELQMHLRKYTISFFAAYAR